MKRTLKKGRAYVQGLSSGVMISLAIHAVVIFFAGFLVVMTIQREPPPAFKPVQVVERKPLELKTLKMSLERDVKPAPSEVIQSESVNPKMVKISLPGIGDRTLGGDLQAEFTSFKFKRPTDGEIFGITYSSGNDFVGTFYDFKRDRYGRTHLMDADKFREVLGDFMRSGWNTANLRGYYQSENKLYATCFMIPPVPSSLAPAAFDEPETVGYWWAAHYRGLLAHKEGVTFRFWGMGDDLLFVRVNGKMVLGAPWPGDTSDFYTSLWQTSSPESRKYYMGNNRAVVGDWITLKPGQSVPMEVLLGEVPGGQFTSMLVVEVKGQEYAKNRQGGPILPMFKTEKPSLDMIETIEAYLVEGEATVTGGPIFRDYDPAAQKAPAARELVGMEAVPPEESAAVAVESKNKAAAVKAVVATSGEEGPRVWSCANGQVFEAEFVAVMGRMVVLKKATGRQVKVPLEKLSAADREFVELANPPDFSISFAKKSEQRIIKQSPVINSVSPKVLDYVFGAKIKQITSRPYHQGLNVELVVFGEEVDGDNFVYLDRQESAFNPYLAENRALEFFGTPVETMVFEIDAQRRGVKYGGYAVSIRDKRGDLIAYESSHDWLYECLDQLRDLPLGKHFDKTGRRVGPPRPTTNRY